MHDNTRFNPISPAQEEHLRGLIEKHGLSQFADRIVSLAQPCILFDEALWREDVIGGTRLGGLPDIPPGWKWPEDLLFLGQFNLEELASHDINSVLPRHGLLSFFFDFQSADKGASGIAHRVFFFEDVASLQRAKAPRGFLLKGLGHSDKIIHAALSVSPQGSISFPSISRHWFRNLDEREEDSALANTWDEAYYALQDELKVGQHRGDRHQMIGFHADMSYEGDEEAAKAAARAGTGPTFPDVPVGSIQFYIGTEMGDRAVKDYNDALQRLSGPNHPYLPQGSIYDKLVSILGPNAWLAFWVNESRHAEKAARLRQEHQATVEEWVLLFQIDSDDRIGTMFSDAGFAYFMIRKGDLSAARFDRTYAGMWSS